MAYSKGLILLNIIISSPFIIPIPLHHLHQSRDLLVSDLWVPACHLFFKVAVSEDQSSKNLDL